MKKTILILLSVFSCLAASAAEGIHFEEGKWDEIKAKAQKEQKYIFLDSYTDWCYWCKVMDKQVFTDTSVSGYINRNFIPVRREMEKEEEGIALSMKYHVNAFPTYLIFSPEGTLVYEILGFRAASEFLAELNKSLAPGLTNPYPGIGPSLNPGFPDFYKESFGTGKKRKWPALKTVTDFLDNQKDLFTEVSWSVMWRFPLNEKYENWIFENRTKLISLFGKDEVEGKILDIISTRVTQAAETKNEKKFKESIGLIKIYHPDNSKDYETTYSMDYYEKTGDWTNYAVMVNQYIERTGYESHSFINSSSWTIYESCDDTSVVAQAITWMDTVTTHHEEYAYLDTYAALLYKNKHYSKAEEVALHAIRIGETAGEDVKATEALLANIRLKLK